jgi:anti-sigma B factor antagonist
MLIKTKQESNYLVLKLLEERLEAHTATVFKQKILDYINLGHRTIILDLSNADFIDSSGLGAIVSILKLLGQTGNLILCGLHGAPLAMIKLTRMDKIFSIYNTAEDAINSL